MQPSIDVTIVVLVVAVLVTCGANILSRRPHVPGRIWHLPYDGIQFVGILVILIMCAHLITIFTGKPFAGRLGP